MIDPSAHVTAAVTCRAVNQYVAGQGIWSYSQVLPLSTAKIGVLMAGSTEPDVEADPSTP